MRTPLEAAREAVRSSYGERGLADCQDRIAVAVQAALAAEVDRVSDELVRTGECPVCGNEVSL